MTGIGRRALLGGLAAAAAAVSAELASFRGAFDHRRGRVDGAARYAASLASIARDPALAAGALVHVGHSTHWLSLGGVRLLTDPWFFDPAFGALAHSRGPAVAPEELGPLDAILVTHDHADHADLRAIDRMDKSALVLAPTRELATRVRALGYARVEVLSAWETAGVGEARVTAVPAEHDVYEVGYVLEAVGRVVYFAGDTRLFGGIRAIAERFTPTLAILPVDGTRLAGGARQTMNPTDAAHAAQLLRAGAVMPSHADALFTDPIAEHLLASTHVGGARALWEALARDVPVVSLSPGEVVPLARRDVSP